MISISLFKKYLHEKYKIKRKVIYSIILSFGYHRSFNNEVHKNKSKVLQKINLFSNLSKYGLDNYAVKRSECPLMEEVLRFRFPCPRAHLLYEKSKRPAFSVPKQISDVTRCLLLGILCKQY